MTQIRFSKSLKKYLRREKAKIRREILDLDERKKAIEELIKPFYKKHLDKKPKRSLMSSESVKTDTAKKVGEKKAKTGKTKD